ncbi:hypothetical protein QUA54_17740 [Microcoleus sp. MOSTC5]|uniref:hypothetical protein n=1 Tax=Microcoleus sp. MOSTC5 TaxID=3055378 RepID=UPI002FCFB59D
MPSVSPVLITGLTNSKTHCRERSLQIVTTPLLLNLPRTLGEQRVIFHHLNWQAYQQIVRAIGESHSAHFTYDRGSLEITMPSEEHEFYR